MLLATLLAVGCATFLTTLAPTAAGAATSRDLDGSSKMLLALSGDEMEDGDDAGVESVESPSDDDFDGDVEDLPLRDLRTKNFVRFGRSSGAATKSRPAKTDGAARFSRGEPDDNFIRLGRSGAEESKVPVTRSANSNFIRLGRARTEPNNFIRLGRTRTEGNNFIRLGRAQTPNNFIRLGRAQTEPSNFIRLGRAQTEPSNFIRLGRAQTEPSNFIRLGRAQNEPSNFIRLGRGNQDFIRFGRGGNEELVDLSDLQGNSTLARLARNSNFIRLGRMPSNNFMRLGKSDNYLRFGKGSPDNFIRFGRGKSDALFGRGKLTDRNFIRLGRSSSRVPEDGTWTGEKDVKPTTKYITFSKTIPGVDETTDRVARFGRDVEHIDEKRQTKSVRRKRSLIDEDDDETNIDDIPYQYYSPLGGVPFAPELTVLPPFYTKRTTGGGNGNFIRLG